MQTVKLENNMLKISIIIYSRCWQVSIQTSESVSYIYSVHDMSCELVAVNYRKLRKIVRTCAEVHLLRDGPLDPFDILTCNLGLL